MGVGGVGGLDNELDEAKKMQTCTEYQKSEKQHTAMQPVVMQKLESQAKINLQKNEAQRNSDQMMTKDKNNLAVYLNTSRLPWMLWTMHSTALQETCLIINQCSMSSSNAFLLLLLPPKETQSESLNNYVLPIAQSTYYCTALLLCRILFQACTFVQ